MKIVVYTLGCKVNQYESESLCAVLQKQGHEVFTHLTKADLYIVNTCAVTNEAERKSRQVVAKCRKLNLNAKIIVCGCSSEKNPSQFEKLKNVTYITGVSKKLNIANNLSSKGINIEKHSKEYDDSYLSNPTKTRAYVKIQDGCNNFCSYCIIPYLRGRSRSRNITSVLKEIDDLSKKVKEIVITGIDVSDYRIDDKRALSTLIDKLASYKNIRFRLSSLEQGVVDESLIEVCKKSNICPHFHLSLQSGCDTVLKRMNRKYKTKDYLQTVKLIRKNYTNPNISTDIIVGFPEETKKEFMQTYRFAKKVGFANIHIFPYSLRSGTVAERFEQVDGNEKKERVKKLEKLNKKLNEKYIRRSKKYVHTVLVEEEENGFKIGHTENYIKCYIPCNVNLNTFVDVKIQKPYKDGVVAQVVANK